MLRLGDDDRGGARKHCGTRSLIAELEVYSRAPGAVARCRTCRNVVMVLVDIRGSIQVRADAFELLDQT